MASFKVFLFLSPPTTDILKTEKLLSFYFSTNKTNSFSDTWRLVSLSRTIICMCNHIAARWVSKTRGLHSYYISWFRVFFISIPLTLLGKEKEELTQREEDMLGGQATFREGPFCVKKGPLETTF